MGLLMGGRGSLLPMFGASGFSDYLWRDDFTADLASGAVIGSAATPGVSTRSGAVVDGDMSISGSALTMTAQTTPTWGDLSLIYSQSVTRAPGVALVCLARIDTNAQHVLPQFAANTALSLNTGNPTWYRSPSSLQVYDNGKLARLDPLDATQEMIYAIVLRTAGALFITNRFIQWVTRESTTATLYARILLYSSAATVRYMRTPELPAPWDDSNGLALHIDTTPTSGDTATGSDEGYQYLTWTPASNETLYIYYRYVSDSDSMAVKCVQASNTIAIVKIVGGVETVLNSVAQTWTAGTPYDIALRYYQDRQTTIVGQTTKNSNYVNAYNLTKAGVKVAGFATATNWEVWPYRIPDAAWNSLYMATQPVHSRSIITVPSGGTISTYIAQMKAGDILEFETGGTYTIPGGTNGFTTLPSGLPHRYTTVRGNGCTITGGAQGIRLDDKQFIDISGINLEDQTVGAMLLNRVRWFRLDGLTYQSDAGITYLDGFKFDECRDGEMHNSIAYPSMGVATLDGFEMYGECVNLTFYDCEASGQYNGFEVWTGPSPSWINSNIRFVRCYSHDNDAAGFSIEGGPSQGVAQEENVCDACTVSNNAGYDYQGIEGSTLYIENYTSGDYNENVVIRS